MPCQNAPGPIALGPAADLGGHQIGGVVSPHIGSRARSGRPTPWRVGLRPPDRRLASPYADMSNRRLAEMKLPSGSVGPDLAPLGAGHELHRTPEPRAGRPGPRRTAPPPVVGVGWSGSTGGSTKKSMSSPIRVPGGTSLSMKLAWWCSQHCRLGFARHGVALQHVEQLVVEVLIADRAGPPRTKPGSKTRASASRPASITAGLVNPTSPRSTRRRCRLRPPVGPDSRSSRCPAIRWRRPMSKAKHHGVPPSATI